MTSGIFKEAIAVKDNDKQQHVPIEIIPMEMPNRIYLISFHNTEMHRLRLRKGSRTNFKRNATAWKGERETGAGAGRQCAVKLKTRKLRTKNSQNANEELESSNRKCKNLNEELETSRRITGNQ